MPAPYDEREYTHGATVIRQGDTGHGFYILQSGALEVFKDSVLLTVLMHPGTVFGEMGDILGRPRTCTVRAKGQAVVAYVPDTQIEQLIREQPDLAVKMIKTLAARLDRTTQKLAEQYRESAVWAVEGGARRA